MIGSFVCVCMYIYIYIYIVNLSEENRKTKYSKCDVFIYDRKINVETFRFYFFNVDFTYLLILVYKKIEKYSKCDEFFYDGKVNIKKIKPKRFNIDFTIINKYITFGILCFSIFFR